MLLLPSRALARRTPRGARRSLVLATAAAALAGTFAGTATAHASGSGTDISPCNYYFESALGGGQALAVSDKLTPGSCVAVGARAIGSSSSTTWQWGFTHAQALTSGGQSSANGQHQNCVNQGCGLNNS